MQRFSRTCGILELGRHDVNRTPLWNSQYFRFVVCFFNTRRDDFDRFFAMLSTSMNFCAGNVEKLTDENKRPFSFYQCSIWHFFLFCLKPPENWAQKNNTETDIFIPWKHMLQKVCRTQLIEKGATLVVIKVVHKLRHLTEKHSFAYKIRWCVQSIKKRAPYYFD